MAACLERFHVKILPLRRAKLYDGVDVYKWNMTMDLICISLIMLRIQRKFFCIEEIIMRQILFKLV